MWLIILLVILFLWIVVAGIKVVKENTVYAIEFFGKFDRIMTPGLNFRVPLVEKIVEEVSLKQQNFSDTARYHTMDRALIDIAINIVFAVIPTTEGVRSYVYSLEERDKTFATTIENSLRASIAREPFNDVLAKKEALTKEIWTEVDAQFKKWGINIISFQITSVRPVQAY